jgi:hypothetical protein
MTLNAMGGYVRGHGIERVVVKFKRWLFAFQRFQHATLVWKSSNQQSEIFPRRASHI